MQEIDSYTFIRGSISYDCYLCVSVHFPVKGLRKGMFNGKIIVITHLLANNHVLRVDFKTDLIFFYGFIEFFKVKWLTVGQISKK